jgi:DNA-binding response OmpR family regulator
MATVLVIDDDPSVGLSVVQVLRSAGHTTLLAADGREGLKVFEKDLVDVVLVDLYMPDMDGVETITALRKASPEVKIIAMSGNPHGTEMLNVAGKLGAIALLEKPFAIADLIAQVNAALK